MQSSFYLELEIRISQGSNKYKMAEKVSKKLFQLRETESFFYDVSTLNTLQSFTNMEKI